MTRPWCGGFPVHLVHPGRHRGGRGGRRKDSPAESLPEAVRTVAAGHALLAPSVTRKVVEEYVRMPALGVPLPDAVLALTER